MARAVTAILMGDPRPNRIAVSDAIRARTCPNMPVDAGASELVMTVIEALADGPLTLAELAHDLGLSLSAGSDRAYKTRHLGLIAKTRGRPCKVFLTPEGEALVP
jgi:hypothetical protein